MRWKNASDLHLFERHEPVADQLHRGGARPVAICTLGHAAAESLPSAFRWQKHCERFRDDGRPTRKPLALSRLSRSMVVLDPEQSVVVLQWYPLGNVSNFGRIQQRKG
jgi:hypothetical protein